MKTIHPPELSLHDRIVCEVVLELQMLPEEERIALRHLNIAIADSLNKDIRAGVEFDITIKASSRPHTMALQLPTACKRCIHFNGTDPCTEAARTAALAAYKSVSNAIENQHDHKEFLLSCDTKDIVLDIIDGLRASIEK